MKHPSIFKAFCALKGFEELLKEQERIVVPKRLLSDDDLEEMDRTVHQITKGMMIEIETYEHGEYIKVKGIVSKINLEAYLLQIVKTKYNLKNITHIEIIE